MNERGNEEEDRGSDNSERSKMEMVHGREEE